MNSFENEQLIGVLIGIGLLLALFFIIKNDVDKN